MSGAIPRYERHYAYHAAFRPPRADRLRWLNARIVERIHSGLGGAHLELIDECDYRDVWPWRSRLNEEDASCRS